MVKKSLLKENHVQIEPVGDVNGPNLQIQRAALGDIGFEMLTEIRFEKAHCDASFCRFLSSCIILPMMVPSLCQVTHL